MKSATAYKGRISKSVKKSTMWRAINYAPSEVYGRICIDNRTRSNRLTIEKCFPKTNGICACGCKSELEGKRKKWATEDCRDFAFIVYAIISFRSDVIRDLLAMRDQYACRNCGATHGDERFLKSIYTGEVYHRYFEILEVDHILPVHQGGGGCWLDNYQLLCPSCHSTKSTNERRGK